MNLDIVLFICTSLLTCGKTFSYQPPPALKPWQRKKTQKGLKSMSGQDEMGYGEVKAKYTFSLTPTAIRNFDKLGKELDLSRSEVVERLGRGLIPSDKCSLKVELP